MCEAAKDAGLAFASEIFADRAYNEDGSLMPRNLPGAVIHDPEIMLERALAMIGTGGAILFAFTGITRVPPDLSGCFTMNSQ